MTSTQIERVSTGMGSVPAVRTSDGDVQVVIKTAVESMGLNYSGVLQRLKRSSWATLCMTPMVAEDGKVRRIQTVSTGTWIMFLATVDESRVSEHLRPLVAEFQQRSEKALRDFWLNGVAVGDHATQEQLVEAQALIKQRNHELRRLEAGAKRFFERNELEHSFDIENEKQQQLHLEQTIDRQERLYEEMVRRMKLLGARPWDIPQIEDF